MTRSDRRPGRAASPREELAAAIEGSGLVGNTDRGVVLVSGGPDSACLAAGLAGLLGPEQLTALHLNYGLRPEADSDQEVAARLCGQLGLELVTARAGSPGGNLQEWARNLRYDQAADLKERKHADWIAVGHSRTDRVETILYRLAASPGTRPLLGMRARRDDLIRPLLTLGREDLRRIAKSLKLPFTDDRSNRDPTFARSRIRATVLPALREINPAAERNIERTHAELAEDEELLARMAAEAVPGGEIQAGALDALPRPLRRRALRVLAERNLGRPVPVPTQIADEVLRLGLDPEGGRVDAGGGASFVAARGRITIEPPEA